MTFKEKNQENEKINFCIFFCSFFSLQFPTNYLADERSSILCDAQIVAMLPVYFSLKLQKWNILFAFHAKDSRLLLSCIKSLYLPLSALSSVDEWHPGIANNIQIALGLIDLNRQQVCYPKRIFSVSQRSLSVHPLCAPFWLDDWFSATRHRPRFHSWPPPIASSLLQKLSSIFFFDKKATIPSLCKPCKHFSVLSYYEEAWVSNLH